MSHSRIDGYYNAVLSCVSKCCSSTIPLRKCGSFREEHVVPGWNEYVADKHSMARNAYCNWVLAGKPRQGPELFCMQQTRSRFKYALRYCQQHEKEIGADMLANKLMDKDCKGFWNSVRHLSNNKATGHATTVGGCSGEDNIVRMWKGHFEKLYNSVNVTAARDKFMTEISRADDVSNDFHISVHDVIKAAMKQKRGKAAGLDGIHMEAFLHGSLRLFVHIGVLFNLFVKYCYVPLNFMSSVIVPLVKCKTKDICDVNNYRAIAISSTILKVFESVILNAITTVAEGDEMQFGFKSGLSTGLCTNVLKTTVD